MNDDKFKYLLDLITQLQQQIDKIKLMREEDKKDNPFAGCVVKEAEIEIAEIVPDTFYTICYGDDKLGEINDTTELSENPSYSITVYNNSGDVIYEEDGIKNFRFACVKIIKMRKLQDVDWNYTPDNNKEQNNNE